MDTLKINIFKYLKKIRILIQDFYMILKHIIHRCTSLKGYGKWYESFRGETNRRWYELKGERDDTTDARI